MCRTKTKQHKTRNWAAKEQKLPPSHRRRHFESLDYFRQEEEEEEESDEEEVVSPTRRLPWPHFAAAAALDSRLD